MPIETLVVEGAEAFLTARTLSALARIGLEAERSTRSELRERLAQRDAPIWVLQGGAWPARAPATPSASATGKPLVALGAELDDPEWKRWMARCAGEADRSPPPSLPSVFVERPALLVRHGDDLDACILRAIESGAVRAVRVPGFDVRFDVRLRVAQVITSLHRGGAERVALDLHRTLRQRSAASTLYVLDPPQRDTYDTPADAVLIHEHVGGRTARREELVRRCQEGAHDVVHAHLLDGADVAALARSGVAVVTTLHNMRRAWPPGLDALAEDDARLVIACAADVHRDAATCLAPPVRTAWNGIEPKAPPDERRATRRRLGLGDALAVITVANPRTQKRLELAAEAIAHLARTRDVHWLLVGAPLSTSDDGKMAAQRLDDAIARLDLETRVHRVGSVADATALLEAADVALSTSAWEGFSIAHLEAIAARLPLVTTAVSGARELAAKHEGVHVVARDATPDAIAAAIEQANEGPKPTLSAELHLSNVGARHEALYRRAIAPRNTGPIWLVTNNFAMGGAQASARRLLLGLRSRGVDARAIVLEEQHAFPTPWRAEMERAGVPTFVAPYCGGDTARASNAIVRAIDAAGADAVLFWNAIAEYKLRIADALLGIPIFDVSPGEMYFASLDRYFARPRPELPYLEPRDYGRLLRGVVVKFEREAERARACLGAEVHVVQNGVPIRMRRPRACREHVVVGTLARVSPDKKLEQLVDGAARASRVARRPFEILVAGPVEKGHEEYARDLEARAAANGVRFVGAVEADGFLDELDLFALVAEPEGCPNASLEAMAAGLPVVATNAGGVAEQIAMGESGLLVPRGDGVALGEAVAALVDDSDARQRMGVAARARVQERFSVERMLDRYQALLVNRSASAL